MYRLYTSKYSNYIFFADLLTVVVVEWLECRAHYQEIMGSMLTNHESSLGKNLFALTHASFQLSLWGTQISIVRKSGKNAASAKSGFYEMEPVIFIKVDKL